ncbi:benzyl alcohol O-benzoyltransferase-like [Neltuma alba]|uniref:benzyl alcohol O-benzoyltransferase-like n=1 Tax=Neltuma alba TaxID=207710 RepID=UPI0010A30794|nr:benzyl alcohol O-benzoyltransferase-like [Prosopis alba]
MAKPFSPTIEFSVRRCQPELVAPAKPTPHVVKLLSDIDDQASLRFQIPLFFFYPHKPSMAGKDPAKLIKKALAETLVFYYPFAGRLREGPGRKLMVDCNEEGVIFIEADADVSLHQFGDPLKPPFPCFEELLYNVPGSEGVTNCPLLLIQVTRLKCGGFIFALRLNHTMSDGAGLVQFLEALAEIAQGACEPSIPPVWRRELLIARDLPRITCSHTEYDEVPNDDDDETRNEDMVYDSFFFGPNQLKAIHQLFPHHQHHQNSTFEVLTAFIWRCRTIALQLEPHKEVRFMANKNVRGIQSNPPLLPLGYYGNGFVFPAVVTTAEKLCRNSFGYALELVKKSKAMATVEYIQSAADLMVIKGRPSLIPLRAWLVSDVTRAGFEDVDFGWGKAIYAGPAMPGAGDFLGASFFVPHKNAKGEEGIVVPIFLPLKSMMIFIKELENNMIISKL